VSGARTERLHHLDALRALTMLLILPAHAITVVCLSTDWGDVEASVFWVIHVFRLPLFFLVAGFFAALLLEVRGLDALLRNRAVRIGIPLVAGVATIVPVLTLALQEVAATPHRPSSVGLGAFSDPHPSYLWFLWYLALLYAIALGARFALPDLPRLRHRVARLGSGALSSPAGPLLLAVPAGLLLYRQTNWIADAPAESFLPRADLLGYYAVFFACGWALRVLPGLRDAIEARPRRYLATAAIALPPALLLYLMHDQPQVGTNRWLHLLALLLLSVSTWSLTFGLLGLSRQLLHRPNPTLRYWTDAAYWIYLSHFPVMAALAIVLLGVPMPNAVRATVLAVLTLAIIFPAYGAFVRHTAIGRVLHGPRRRVRPPLTVATPPAAAAGR
jgi:glucan biosynthesis protein C